MPTIGYHASHEQFAASELVELVRLAAQAGFRHIGCSDHFQPWSQDQGHANFAWAWLGAAMSTCPLSFSVVCAPGQRYHPAIIAQAVATLNEMYPGRLALSVGSGENLNESITDDGWPDKPTRNARLKECVDVMRALWAGETVTHRGLVRVRHARLWPKPTHKPFVFGAAITPETASWLGSWADGLITISLPPEQLRRVVEAFRSGGGAGKPMCLKVQLAYDRDEARARRGALEQWRTNVFPSRLLSELETPEQFEAAATFVGEGDLDSAVRISSDLGRHVRWLQEDLALGFDTLLLHNVHTAQREFIEDFGREVLPALAR